MNHILLKPSLFFSLIAVSFFLPVAARTEQLQSARCKKAVARMITSGDQNFRPGNLLCPQDYVLPLTGKQPKLICHKSGRVLAGHKGRVGELCAVEASGANFRGEDDSDLSVNPRGNEGELKLITPFGPTIIQRRPDLSWKPTAGASHYSVRIKGYQLNLEQEVSETRLDYPQAWPSLQYGSVYHIDIFGWQRGTIISADRATINLLFEKEAIAIQENAAAIQQLPFPLREVAVELDTLFMTRNLFHETIQVLESLREKGQSNPKLDQLLARRYSQAGHPDLAKSLQE